MTKFKNSNAICLIILELAKANNWLSRADLKQKTGKEIQTIKNYLKNDISHLIEAQNFIEDVNRNAGKGKTNIEKYKLKPGLDNLLAVFDYLDASHYYLDDKQLQKELIRTDFFKNQIPEIFDKMLTDFYINKEFYSRIFKENEVNRLMKLVFISPTAIHYLLKLKNNNVENAKKEIYEIYPGANFKGIDELVIVLFGLIFKDVIDETISPSQELILPDYYPWL